MRPQQPIERHTMAVLVDNEAGVLARELHVEMGWRMLVRLDLDRHLI